MSIGSGGDRSSIVTKACTAFDEGAKDEALSPGAAVRVVLALVLVSVLVVVLV